jgi:hypothetical protein
MPVITISICSIMKGKRWTLGLKCIGDKGLVKVMGEGDKSLKFKTASEACHAAAHLLNDDGTYNDAYSNDDEGREVGLDASEGVEAETLETEGEILKADDSDSLET